MRTLTFAYLTAATVGATIGALIGLSAFPRRRGPVWPWFDPGPVPPVDRIWTTTPPVAWKVIPHGRLNHPESETGDPDCFRNHNHRPPMLACTCGWYATKRIVDTLNRTGVLCQVELSGRVIEHRHGYRAQRYRIRRIVWPLSARRLEPQLRKAGLWAD